MSLVKTCDGCFRTQFNVRELVALPKDLHICGDCIEIAMDYLKESRKEQAEKIAGE